MALKGSTVLSPALDEVGGCERGDRKKGGPGGRREVAKPAVPKFPIAQTPSTTYKAHGQDKLTRTISTDVDWKTSIHGVPQGSLQ